LASVESGLLLYQPAARTVSPNDANAKVAGAYEARRKE